MFLSKPPSETDVFFRLPKIELHRHLEGSIRLDTLQEIAGNTAFCDASGKSLAALVQVQDGDSLNVLNFLSKFQVLRKFYRSKEIINRVVYEAIADAAHDGVRYMELRFAPSALCQFQGFAMEDVIDWVIASTAKAEQDFGMMTRLIATINRQESVKVAETVAHLSAERIPDGLLGLDLAGNEVEFSAVPFIPVFDYAKNAGLAITVHAGEWSGAESVRLALTSLHAQRIGHGVRILEDANLVKMAAERNIVFEVCVTSNLQTGVVASIEEHPLMKMLEAGLNITINTDDPMISVTNLSREYQIVCDTLGLSYEKLVERILAAAESAFLPEEQKRSLLKDLRQEFNHVSEK